LNLKHLDIELFHLSTAKSTGKSYLSGAWRNDTDNTDSWFHHPWLNIDHWNVVCYINLNIIFFKNANNLLMIIVTSMLKGLLMGGFSCVICMSISWYLYQYVSQVLWSWTIYILLYYIKIRAIEVNIFHHIRCILLKKFYTIQVE